MKKILIFLILIITGLNSSYSQHLNLSQSQIENLISVLNQYEDFDYFGEGISGVMKDGKWGIINMKGEILIPFDYENIELSNSKFKCETETGYEYYEEKNGNIIPISEKNTEKGEIKGPEDFRTYEYHKKNFDFKRKNGKWGLIDGNGRLVIPYILEDVTKGIEGGPAVVRKGSKYGYVDEDGYLTDYIYDFAETFYDGLARVTKDDKTTFINEKGIEILPFRYYDIRTFGDKYFFIVKQRIMTDFGEVFYNGVIDKLGSEIIPCEYTSINEWKDGFILQKNISRNPRDYGPYKYIITDFSGRNLGEGEYDKIIKVGDRMMDLITNHKHKLLVDNKILLKDLENVLSLCKTPNEYFPESNKLLKVQMNGKWGIFNKEKGIVVPPEYDEIMGSSNHSYVKIKKNNEWAIFDLSNEEFFTPFFSIKENKKINTPSIESLENSNKIDYNKIITEISEVQEEQAELPLSQEINDGNMVSTDVEKTAVFPGGIDALNNYLSHSIRYPIKAFYNKIEGVVYVKLQIEKNGKISKAEISSSVDKDLDREALRIVGKMPAWIPAQSNGEPVRSYYNLPVTFKLSK